MKHRIPQLLDKHQSLEHLLEKVKTLKEYNYKSILKTGLNFDEGKSSEIQIKIGNLGCVSLDFAVVPQVNEEEAETDPQMTIVDCKLQMLTEDDDSDTINIFINGFLTQNDNFADWVSNFNLGGTNYGLHWESGTLLELGVFLRTLSHVMLSHSKVSTNFRNGIHNPLEVSLLFPFMKFDMDSNPWYQTLAKTSSIAEILRYKISQFDKKKTINIFGHSLGCRIIHSLLSVLEKEDNYIINDVILMGGATGCSSKEWEQSTQGLQGKIYNFYSAHDDTLRYLYQVSQFGEKPVGLFPIDLSSHKIVNIDASSYINGHREYKNTLEKILSDYQTAGSQSLEKYVK